jgi:hypothetical protein
MQTLATAALQRSLTATIIRLNLYKQLIAETNETGVEMRLQAARHALISALLSHTMPMRHK